jgi:hypothetical protein
MTTSEIIIVAAACSTIVGSAVFLLMAGRLRGGEAAAQKGEVTAEQLRGVSELTGQLERLVKDIDGKIADHLSRIDAAMLRADAKAAQLRQAAMMAAPEQPLDAPELTQLAQAQSEEAGRPIWEPAQAIAGDGHVRGFLKNRLTATLQTEESPYGATTNEDELVTLPGTWPVPPSRPETAGTQAPPPNASKLQSPRHAEVLRLHKQGLAAQDIARKLRMDVGEIELVLRLHGAEVEPC